MTAEGLKYSHHSIKTLPPGLFLVVSRQFAAFEHIICLIKQSRAPDGVFSAGFKVEEQPELFKGEQWEIAYDG